MVPYKPLHHHPGLRVATKAALSSEAEFAPPAYDESAFKGNFACLTLYKSDRIRLLQFPPDDIAAIRDVIKQHWPSGIQEERAAATSHEFKCLGTPWSTGNAWTGQGADAIAARILMRAILEHLFSRGWLLSASTGVSKALLETATLIFRKQDPPPPASEWLAISFNQSNRLRLIGAPAELNAAFEALLKGLGLCQEAAWKERALDAFEFKIRGRPWRPQGDEAVATRLLLLRLLETLEAGGWSLYATVDQNNGNHGNNSSVMATDSWYCVRAADWVPGSSVFHR